MESVVDQYYNDINDFKKYLINLNNIFTTANIANAIINFTTSIISRLAEII